jgi:hypothetical protein
MQSDIPRAPAGHAISRRGEHLLSISRRGEHLHAHSRRGEHLHAIWRQSVALSDHHAMALSDHDAMAVSDPSQRSSHLHALDELGGVNLPIAIRIEQVEELPQGESTTREGA